MSGERVVVVVVSSSRLPRGIGSIVLLDKSDFRDGAITFLRERVKKKK